MQVLARPKSSIASAPKWFAASARTEPSPSPSTSTSPSSSPSSTTDAPQTHRVVSLLPFLTDIVCELGAGKHLVAASHDCVRGPSIPAVTRPRLLPTDADSPAEIAAAWQLLCAAGGRGAAAAPDVCAADAALRRVLCSYYSVDVEALRALAPTVLLTHVATAAGVRAAGPCSEVEPLLRGALRVALPSVTSVLSCDARSFDDLLSLQNGVCAATGAGQSALHGAQLRLHHGLDAAEAAVRASGVPFGAKRVGIVQWSEPLYVAGGWVHDAVRAGGGRSGGTKAGSVVRDGAVAMHASAALVEYDVLVFALCGLGLKQCERALAQWWRQWGFLASGKRRPTLVATDARQLFSSMSAERVAQAAEVVAEVVGGANWFGHHRVLWDYWQPE